MWSNGARWSPQSVAAQTGIKLEKKRLISLSGPVPQTKFTMPMGFLAVTFCAGDFAEEAIKFADFVAYTFTTWPPPVWVQNCVFLVSAGGHPLMSF
jgi:hypothetical protein